MPARSERPATADVVVIGAGVVGAATAAALPASGWRVCVVNRAGPLGGTTAAGEGNILVSDKVPGPELALALRSLELWRAFAAEADATAESDPAEFEPKGGLVVAHNEQQLAALRDLGIRQAAAGVAVQPLDAGALREAEPRLSADLAGGALYPQDCQVQPMRAALAYLSQARRHGAVVIAGAAAVALETTADRADSKGSPGQDGQGEVDGPGRRVSALMTSRGRIATPVVVNASGPWSGDVARRLGSALPVWPRRGRILVTEPLPAVIPARSMRPTT